jgi:hypothetical protein
MAGDITDGVQRKMFLESGEETLAKRSRTVFSLMRAAAAEGANAKSFISVHLLASGETINFAQRRTSCTLMAIDIFTRLVRRDLITHTLRRRLTELGGAVYVVSESPAILVEQQDINQNKSIPTLVSS